MSEVKVVIAEFLQSIIDGRIPEDSADYDNGLCYIMAQEVNRNCIEPFSHASDICVKFIKSGAKDWEHYTGIPNYPVKLPAFVTDDMISEFGYHYWWFKSNKWEGEQLALRKDLCKHLLGKVEEYFNE